MSQYLLRRLILLIPTVIGLTLLTFTIANVVPADPAKLAAGPRATDDMVETIRQEYGLDKPLYVQYFTYMRNLAQGDLGNSIISRRPVAEDLRRFFPATLELVLASMIVAILIGIPLGVISATHQNKWQDQFSRVSSISFVSLPRFWFAIILQLIIAARLGWLPLGGRLPPTVEPPQRVTGMYTVDSLLQLNFSTFWLALQHLTLPALVFAIGTLAIVTRTVRGDMLETLNQDYVRTARAKGLSERKVVYNHALRNSFIPTLTLIGLSFGFALGGSVLIEIVFDWPGIGLYAAQSALQSDFEPIMGVTIMIGIIFILLNLATDLLYGVLDPRIRYR